MQIIDIDLAQAVQAGRRAEAAQARLLNSIVSTRDTRLNLWSWALRVIHAGRQFRISQYSSPGLSRTHTIANVMRQQHIALGLSYELDLVRRVWRLRNWR